jgi:hypothetical protein
LPSGIATGFSDTFPKQAQIDTVVVQQEKVDRVGFEPTTSSLASQNYNRDTGKVS